MDPLEEKPLKTDSSAKKRSFGEKIRYVKENITIEPVLAFYVIPGSIARLATQNLNLDKACRVNLNYGDTVCDSLIARESNKYLKEELMVQELVASMEVWKNILLTALPSFLILFLGAWSDRTRKRKICILLPIIGDLLMCMSNIVSVFFFYELPVQVTMFLEAIFPAITGAWITTYMGVFSYISDISSEESRTFRIGIANLCLTAGGPIGNALSGILLNKIGYYGVFVFSALLKLFSICYGFYCIHDPKRPVTEKNAKTGVCGFLKSFFDVKHVRDTLVVAFKRGPNNRRAKSILILACIVFIQGPGHGEFTIRYLFTRYRFGWDAMKYSFYSTFYICVHALGDRLLGDKLSVGLQQNGAMLGLSGEHWTYRYDNVQLWTPSGALISISLFSRYFKWHDSALGLISNCSKIIGSLATSRAKTSLDLYLAVGLETFNATSFTALRSLSSKLVTTDELGKMTSFFNMVEMLSSMVFGPIYSWVYKETIALDAGTVYYISSVLTVPPVLIFAWFFTQRKKSSNPNDGETEKSKQKHGCEDEVAGQESLIIGMDIADIKVYTE